jgi:AraC-like DNA-binding protein
MAAAPTLREGLAGLLPFQEILGDRPEFCFDEQRDRARFRFEPFALSLEVARARAELAVVGFWRLLETVHGGKGRAAYFAHARPSYGDEYERILGERARFEHSFSGIVFPVELLDQPLLLRNPSVHRALSQQATQVRSRVLSLPAVPEMPRAASAVGISERSLRRRLEDEGSTYSQLVEEAKLDLSRELLADHARPIKQVAGALGFADVRSFHRAFKRWTGLTPVAYRAQR